MGFIAACIVWAWVAINTFLTVIGSLVFYSEIRTMKTEDQDEIKPVFMIAAGCALNAILGLMLIQTLGLTV